jgi:hypothetical protein
MARFEKVTERIDQDGVSQKTAQIINIQRLPPEPPYIKLYISDIGRMYGLRPSHQDILLYITAGAGFDNIVSLSKRKKGAIALTVGCKFRTVENAITELVRLQILKRIGRGEYEIDPRLFARGEWETIRKRRESFTAAIKYLPDGSRRITTTRNQEKE